MSRAEALRENREAKALFDATEVQYLALWDHLVGI